MDYKEHAIIVIKNNEGKYLQYFDERWDSFLFPNCKLVDENHFDNIFKILKDKFGFDVASDDVTFCMDKVHSKFSESNKIMKTYKHYFYNVKFSDNMKSLVEDVVNKGLFVEWMTIAEMKKSARIMQVNSDIVGFVEEIENTPKI